MPAALPPAIAAPMEPQSEQFPATPTNGTAPAFQTPGMVGTAQRFWVFFSKKFIAIVQEVVFHLNCLCVWPWFGQNFQQFVVAWKNETAAVTRCFCFLARESPGELGIQVHEEQRVPERGEKLGKTWTEVHIRALCFFFWKFFLRFVTVRKPPLNHVKLHEEVAKFSC